MEFLPEFGADKFCTSSDIKFPTHPTYVGFGGMRKCIDLKQVQCYQMAE